MSECTTHCLGDEPGHGHLHINRPRFVEYLVYAREPYMRHYTLVTRTDSERHAYEVLAETMRTHPNYKRGLIAGSEGPDSYYEPTKLAEMKR